jgi:hypothetical protein
MYGVRVPGYIFVISIHLAGGLLILSDPKNPHFVISTLLIQSIYVWCRVFYSVFTAVRVFMAYRYTLAIAFSGFLLIPAAMNAFAGNLLIIAR